MEDPVKSPAVAECGTVYLGHAVRDHKISLKATAVGKCRIPDGLYSFSQTKVALETAARKYDPTAGRFTTYSGTLIVNNIRHKLRVSKTKGKEDSKHRPNDTLSLDLDETENGISGLYRMMSSKYNCFEDAEISALFQEIATDEADYLWKYYMEGYSVRMVADYYGEKEYAVRKTIKNAEKRIRDIYQNETRRSE